MLQNIHLTSSWLPNLEKRIEALADGSIHPDFRLFLSAEPSGTPEKSVAKMPHALHLLSFIHIFANISVIPDN